MTDTPTPHEDEEYVTAVHEAGHAIYAIAAGVWVELISIRPDQGTAGRVTHRHLPTPRQVDCETHSLWTDIAVKLCLSGDRAVRRHHALKETATGGLQADYMRAVRLLEALCDDGPHVERELERHSHELDEFFARPDIESLVEFVAALLLDDDEITGEYVHNLLHEGNCGALCIDTGMRCNKERHQYGDHYFKTFNRETFRVEFEKWPGFNTSDKTLKSKRIARHRHVIRAVRPDLYPKPNQTDKIEDILGPGGRALTKPTKTDLDRVARHIQKRGRNGRSLLPPHESFDRETVQELDQHRTQCGYEPDEHDDGALWCAHCGLEVPGAGSSRRSHIYLVVRRTAAQPIDDDETRFFDEPCMPFTNPEDAGKYVRLASQTGENRLRIRRMEFVPTSPS